MKKKLMITIGAIIGVIVLGFSIFQTNASQAAPKLSSEDVQQFVKNQYPGTITEIELEKKLNGYVYEVDIEGDGKKYSLKLDADTGEVLKLEEKFIEKERIALDESKTTNDQKEEKSKEKVEKKEKVEENTEKQEKSQPKTTTKKNDQQKMIGPKKAIDIALNKFPGTVKDLELDDDDGRLIYEIEIKNGYEEAEFDIDAYTGEILEFERDRDDDKFTKKAAISAKKAIDIALGKFSGTVKELELDEDDGRLIYEVEIKNGSEEAEIDIDALTGEVLVIEIDN